MNFAQQVHEGVFLDKLKGLFPDAETHIKSRKQSCIIDPITGAYLELDAWIPKYELSFEFQDAYHYMPIWYKQITQGKIQQTDGAKKDLILQHGTTLVYIPCWWDGTMESLESTIHFQRPDLCTTPVAHLIPLNPPAKYFQEIREIPEVGGLMLASFPSDPNFSSSISSRAWWVGEKYDGVRLCWSGSSNAIFSRTGKVLRVLPAMASHLSTTACLDGEFWFGRGQFSHACLLSIGTTELVHWESLRALLFDISAYKYHSQPFEVRYSHLVSSLAPSNPFGIVAPRIRCENAEHLEAMARDILDDNGEGLILRKFGSSYEPGRSENLLKLKRFQGDQEAIVVRIGKEEQPVTIKLPTGHIIDVPLQNVHVPKLQVGDIITFSFDSNVRRELPVNPQIHKVRTDLSWQDVLNNSRAEPKSLNAKSQIAISNPARGARVFLEGVAVSCRKDPLLPQTWYSLQSQLSSFVERKFKGNYFRILQNAFPEIRFEFAPAKEWKSVGKRREFFEHYAKSNKFNALNVGHWYSQSIGKILSVKGATGLVRYYGNSVTQALQHLFPDIGFVTQKDRGWWNDSKNARQFFEKFAKDHGFDARSADDWHSQSRKRLLDVVGINMVVSHYGGVTKSLLKLFPNIGLDRLKFQISYYRTLENRRKLFEDYAMARCLDFQISRDWYNINMDLPGLLDVKGINGILYYHGRNLFQAIIDLFPKIGLEKTKLHAAYMSGKRRRMLEKYAERAGFDHLIPENWYKHPRDQILAAEGMSRVISHYNNCLSQALVDLFPDIGLEEIKLEVPAWREISVRRKFFEDYATAHGIDPTNSDDWYTSSLSSKALPTDTVELLLYHKNSVQEAIVDLFPELKLNKDYFDPRHYWSNPLNRRKFFENYANTHGIDPHDPLSWNSQPISRIMASKGANKVMTHHTNVTKALSELFSDVGFDFGKLQLKYHINESTRRPKIS